MFKKQNIPLDALTPRRHAVVKPRRYKFPPLRKSWQQEMVDQAVPQADPQTLQQQLTQGFQEGMNRGFAQGMEEGKSEGYQEGARLGFEEGMRKGVDEGKQQARQQMLKATAPFARVQQEMQQLLESYALRQRQELLQLVEKVTRQVIRCELTLHPNQLLTLVEEALSALPQPPERIRVLLNSEEFQRISEADPEKAQQWGLTADASLAPGECRVVTDSTEIDVGCQHRLDQCMDALKTSLLPDAHDE